MASCETADWQHSHVSEFLASDQVRADKAVRAPGSALLESTLDFAAARQISLAGLARVAEDHPRDLGKDEALTRHQVVPRLDGAQIPVRLTP